MVFDEAGASRVLARTGDDGRRPGRTAFWGEPARSGDLLGMAARDP
jgi:hypothetical protein